MPSTLFPATRNEILAELQVIDDYMSKLKYDENQQREYQELEIQFYELIEKLKNAD